MLVISWMPQPIQMFSFAIFLGQTCHFTPIMSKDLYGKDDILTWLFVWLAIIKSNISGHEWSQNLTVRWKVTVSMSEFLFKDTLDNKCLCIDYSWCRGCAGCLLEDFSRLTKHLLLLFYLLDCLLANPVIPAELVML